MDKSEIEVLKAQTKWIAEKVDRMDGKLDRLIQSHAFFKGKVIGAAIAASFIISIVVKIIF